MKKDVEYIVEKERIRRRIGLKPVFAFVMSALFTALILSTVSYIGESASSNTAKSPSSAVAINGIITEVVDFKSISETTEGTKLEEEKTEEPQEEKKAEEPAATTGDKTVYLTFDDGPGDYTARLLDILKKYDIKATFFVTCKGPDNLISRAFKEGHAVGLHTCSHVYDIYRSVDTYFNDLNKIAARVSKITGTAAKIIRFPGGSSNTVSAKYKKGIMTTLSSEVEKRGYKYFDWNVASLDTDGANTADAVFKNVINGVNKRGSGSFSVVLQHDLKSYSVEAVEKIIQYGQKNGYVFKALDTSSPTVHHKVNN